MPKKIKAPPEKQEIMIEAKSKNSLMYSRFLIGKTRQLLFKPGRKNWTFIVLLPGRLMF